ncbi:hypothetical protein D3C87_1450510 [compost metagenome]
MQGIVNILRHAGRVAANIEMAALFEPLIECLAVLAHTGLNIDLFGLIPRESEIETGQHAIATHLSKFVFVDEIRLPVLVAEKQPVPALCAPRLPFLQKSPEWRNARAGSHHDNRCVIVLRHAKRLVRRDENPGTLPRFYPVREIGGAHAATLATFGAITHAGDCQMHAVVRGQRAGRDRIGAML